MKLSNADIRISITAVNGVIEIIVPTPVTVFRIILTGMLINAVASMPISPEQSPSVIVSALNNVNTSLFDAPRLRRMPISFVRSSTEI